MASLNAALTSAASTGGRSAPKRVFVAISIVSFMRSSWTSRRSLPSPVQLSSIRSVYATIVAP